MDANRLKDHNYKHPVRNINNEILSRLSLEDNRIRPLPGGTGRRLSSQLDSRLPYLQPNVGLTSSPGEEVCFYEHVATIRYRDPRGPMHDKFFVAFRQTMDALLAEQQNTNLYPEHVMKSDVKKTELKTYIYSVHTLPRKVKIMHNFEDWLVHVVDVPTFDTLAYFLLKSGIFTVEMYGRAK